MKHKDLAFILYSHSSLQWIWDAFVGEMREYFPIDCNKYIFADDTDLDEFYSQSIFGADNLFYYTNEWKYAKRLVECLKGVEEEFVLIHHEDMIFMSDVDMDMFDYYYSILKHNEQFAYIKMLRGGISNSAPIKFSEGLYYVQPDEKYRYAVQPAIWRKSKLLEVLNHCIDSTIYELEDSDKASEYMIEKGMQCLFAYNEDDQKRGMYHWDNNKYPFIATALQKGQWNEIEYPMEIENLKRGYGLK